MKNKTDRKYIETTIKEALKESKHIYENEKIDFRDMYAHEKKMKSHEDNELYWWGDEIKINIYKDKRIKIIRPYPRGGNGKIYSLRDNVIIKNVGLYLKQYKKDKRQKNKKIIEKMLIEIMKKGAPLTVISAAVYIIYYKTYDGIILNITLKPIAALVILFIIVRFIKNWLEE